MCASGDSSSLALAHGNRPKNLNECYGDISPTDKKISYCGSLSRDALAVVVRNPTIQTHSKKPKSGIPPLRISAIHLLAITSRPNVQKNEQVSRYSTTTLRSPCLRSSLARVRFGPTILSAKDDPFVRADASEHCFARSTSPLCCASIKRIDLWRQD